MCQKNNKAHPYIFMTMTSESDFKADSDSLLRSATVLLSTQQTRIQNYYYCYYYYYYHLFYKKKIQVWISD